MFVSAQGFGVRLGSLCVVEVEVEVKVKVMRLSGTIQVVLFVVLIGAGNAKNVTHEEDGEGNGCK